MDKIIVKDIENSCYFIKGNLTSNSFVFDCANFPDKFLIKVDKNLSPYILLINLKNNNDISIDVDQYSSTRIAMLAKEEISDLKIHVNLEKYAEIDAYFADFLVGQNKTEVEVNLNDEEAACAWHLASLATGKDKKTFDVSAYHNHANTYCRLDNYGVCLDESQLTFSGICKIHKGSSGSKAHQNAKIMVFDEKCKGIARPILKIDENDIEASHAAVVGKINDDHLFYLTSRGLSEEEAKKLITLGYLKPILNGFDDEERKEEITQLIEERI